MVSRIYLGLILLFFLTACISTTSNKEEIEEEIKIIPAPQKILKRSGTIELTNTFWVIADLSDSVTSALAKYLVEQINAREGANAYITDLFSTRQHEQSIKIELINTGDTNQEAYTLTTNTPNIHIKSSGRQGLLNGIHSVLQLLESGALSANSYTINKMVIKDQPVMRYRGIALTNSCSQQDLQKLVHEIARLKLNFLVVATEQELENYLIEMATFYGIAIHKIGDPPFDSLAVTNTLQTDSISLLFNNPDTLLFTFTFTFNDFLKSKKDLEQIAELCWTGKIQ